MCHRCYAVLETKIISEWARRTQRDRQRNAESLGLSGTGGEGFSNTSPSNSQVYPRFIPDYATPTSKADQPSTIPLTLSTETSPSCRNILRTSNRGLFHPIICSVSCFIPRRNIILPIAIAVESREKPVQFTRLVRLVLLPRVVSGEFVQYVDQQGPQLVEIKVRIIRTLRNFDVHKIPFLPGVP